MMDISKNIPCAFDWSFDDIGDMFDISYLGFQVSVENMIHIGQPCAWYNQLLQDIRRNVSMKDRSSQQQTYHLHMKRFSVPSN